MSRDPACEQLIRPTLLRRPGNALNIEIGAPLPRCRLKMPDNWTGSGRSSLRWIASGGDLTVFGPCTPNACPSAFAYALSVVEAGGVLQCEHPDFGGTLTVGPYHAADGQPFAILSHGCSVDLDAQFESAVAAVRAFVFQVGKKSILAAASRGAL